MTLTRDREVQPAQPQGLLDLVPHVRHRIYQYLGMASFDGHSFTYYLDGRKPSPQSEAWISEHEPPPISNFMGLLRSCRVLYAETTALFYSSHNFVVFHSHQGSLGPLRVLSPTSLASLTNLKIVLNDSSCHNPAPAESWRSAPYCCSYGHNDGPWRSGLYNCTMYHGNRHSRPLLDSTPSVNLDPGEQAAKASTIMSEWHETAAYLSPHIGVRRLVLLFVCDINAEHRSAPDIARLAIAPIALFPRLKSCHVRLGKLPNYQLQQLAQEAVLRGQDPSNPSPLGPASKNGISSEPALMSLPAEIRLRILECTDLITPWKEVTWSREDSAYQVHRPFCDRGRNPHIHHGCRLSRCDPSDDHIKTEALSPGCFCRRRHSAFSLVCNCRCPPTYLFLVCRTLLQEAEFVFYSQNRFIVHDYQASRPCQLPIVQTQHVNIPEQAGPKYYYPFNRYAASHFLREIVPRHCLTHIRFLELVFPPYVAQGWPHAENHNAPRDWLDTIKALRRRINAPALSIRLVMADFHDGIAYGRAVMTEPLEKRILDGYESIVHPLISLVQEDGLSGFYMEAAPPMAWTSDTVGATINDRGLLTRMRRDMKEMCEAYVRGKDANPDSIKPEPKKSTWWFWYDERIIGSP